MSFSDCFSVIFSDGFYAGDSDSDMPEVHQDTRIDLNGDNCYHLVGSSNGLVCISSWDRDFLVVNPSTREVKELRNPPQHILTRIEVSGFGYDSSIDDYKVVIGFINKCYKLAFIVLTLKSNFWRSVAGELCGYCMLNHGTLCNGALHWICHVKSDQSHRKVIVSFDLSKEVIKEIPKPDQCDIFEDEGYILGTIKDRLCIIPYRDKHLKKTEEIEIWVMKNYKVRESWKRWLPPPGYDGHKTIMSYTPHYRFFDGHVNIWMLEEGSRAPELVHSLKRPGQNDHIKLSTISECNCNFDLPVFVKSLVSIHGNGGSLVSKAMLEEGSGAAVLVHTKSCETLECHTICNKSQRFVKISQDQKAFFKKKVKENAKKPLRPKHKVRGKTKTYVIEDEEVTDMLGDEYDGILDHNLKLVRRRAYTFKDFLNF